MRPQHLGFLVALAVATAATAGAQDKDAARKACAPDYKKFCAGVTIGGGRIKKCLAEHLEQLTPDCRAAVIAFSNKDGAAGQ